MYIFANRGANMSPGKLAAQVAHAAVEAFQLSDPELIKAWYVGRHHTKLVMQAEDEMHLLQIERYLDSRGFKTIPIIDEGRTEIRPFTHTALGVEIVDKDDPEVQAAFADFKTYREPPPDSRKRQRRVRNGLTGWLPTFFIAVFALVLAWDLVRAAI